VIMEGDGDVVGGLCYIWSKASYSLYLCCAMLDNNRTGRSQEEGTATGGE